MPGSSRESEHHCGLLEEAEDFRPPQHLQSQRRVCQVHKDNVTLPNCARPALPANVAKVPKPGKAELEGRYRSRFDQ